MHFHYLQTTLYPVAEIPPAIVMTSQLTPSYMYFTEDGQSQDNFTLTEEDCCQVDNLIESYFEEKEDSINEEDTIDLN